MPHASLPAHSRHTWSRVFIVLKSSQCLLRAAARGQEAQLGTLSQCPRAVFFFTHRSGVSPQRDGLHQPGYPFLSLSLHDHALWERRGTAQGLRKAHSTPAPALPLVLERSGSLMQIFSTSSTAKHRNSGLLDTKRQGIFSPD